MPPSDSQPDWVIARRRAIGDHIRAARLHANLSQERLAELAGMDRQAVNRIEQGHASPKIDTLIRIAAALDTPLANLVR
ncbi:helix-turn-helix transcriptional regulator [Streptomyces sp. NPDC042207]|uniref:helix-turn-helix domain-containing protein n=1 Tax=Streptomyces sp. NPDC042207 TaxID=3154331 RepID=UPI0033CE181F